MNVCVDVFMYVSRHLV